MSQRTDQYRAYLKATGTVAKTRQVVMLYDAAIRHLKQTSEAISQKRIEDRYKLTVKATEIISALQSSIDFENGGKLAGILHGFYTGMFRRIVGLNFIKDAGESENQCNTIIEELKQMRQTWDTIDLSLGSNAPAASQPASAPTQQGKPDGDPVVISA